MSIYEASSRNAALRHPLAGIAFAFGNKALMHRAIILESAKYLFGKKFNRKQWENAIREIEAEKAPVYTGQSEGITAGNNLNTTFGKWIYCCVRVLQPEIMVETGVSHGSSSRMILKALHHNKKGKLYSIDLPDLDTNADYNNTRSTGWMVTEDLRSRWELIKGDAKLILPELLQKLNQVDIFFHDSDHSYEHMKFEFNTVMPYLSPEGILLSDDVHKNRAFGEFVSQHNLRALQFNKGGCALPA